MQNKNIKNINKIKSFDKLFKELSKSKNFVNSYNEELFRLKMASRIKTLRTQGRMTQKGFADKARMPQSVIARIESGNHTFSLVTLNKVAHALGKKVELV
ncbi:MAG TPA: helix-turn-helix transcriptional regulator [Candidatus Paceibacterota bacterium]|nr:helix-turn-helix transcriptional regulator [Candidatus Paceibacterota bacterium]